MHCTYSTKMFMVLSLLNVPNFVKIGPSVPRYGDFSILSWIFKIFEILTVIRVRRVKMRQRAKFCEN